MLHESAIFSNKSVLPDSWRTDSFHYCRFELLNDISEPIEGVYLSSEFEACHWYWGHFNCATLVGCRFKNCRFDGCAFSSCRFMECSFEGCIFGTDSMGKPCTFEDCRWYGCAQTQCQGLPAFEP